MHTSKLTLFFGVFALATLSVVGCGSKADETPKAAEESGSKLVENASGKGVQMTAESINLAGITLVSAGKDKLTATMQPTGEISPTDTGTVQVTSRLPGKVTEALVSAGDRVKKGQTIAWIDSLDLNQAMAAYATATSHANLVKNQLDQQKKLAGYGSLSEQPVEDARKAAFAADATVASDEAQIKVDRLALQSTQKLIAMGEITRKPVEDATNAYSQAKAAAVQARVSLHSARANLDRIKILYDGGAYSKQQYEDAETAYNSAVAAVEQANTAENLAKQELDRQQTIFNQNLNGASSLQAAESKLLQDQHGYTSDLTAQALAHKQYERALQVRTSGIPISQAIQQAQDAYDEATVAVQSAANTLKLYGVEPGSSANVLKNGRVLVPILAPIDGIVAARAMVVGQMTDTSTPLVRLVNLDKVFIDAQVYEKDVQGVAVGDSVKVHVSALPNKVFEGKVKFVANEISMDTRTMTVRTVIDNPGWVLRPGMFASVAIGSKRTVTAIAIPSEAVMQEGGKQVVYVQTSPGTFIKRTVIVGSPIAGKVPVDSGVKPGDDVVVGGNVYIQKEQEKLEAGKSKG